MKRTFSLSAARRIGLLIAGTGLIAATYGLVRLAYGLFLPDVQRDLGFDAAVAGAISSGASILYCVGAVVGFVVGTRRPRGLVIAAGLSAIIGAVGMAASGSALVFAMFAIGASAGAGLASPGLVTLVARNLHVARRDRGQSIVNAGTGPGLALAGALAIVLLPDWRLAWLLAAGVTALAVLGVLLFDRGENAAEEDAASAPAARPDRAPARRALPPARWFRDHAAVIVAALLLGAGSAATWTFGRTLLLEAGMTEGVSVGAWIALGIGGTAVIATARALSALTPRAAWVVTTIAVAASTAALALAPGSTGIAFAACAVFGWGYTAATGSLISWTSRLDADRASAGTALLFVTLVLGQAVGASALGSLVAPFGMVTTFLVAAVIALAGAAVTAAGRRERTPIERERVSVSG